MTPSFVLVLVITGGVISATGLLASWMIRLENIKFFLNSSTVISHAPQTERTILAATLTIAKGLSKAQTHTKLPEPTSMKSEQRVTSGSPAVQRASSAVAIVEPFLKTTAGSQKTTSEGRVTSPETVEKTQTSPITPERSLTKIATRIIQTTEVGSATAKKNSPTTNAETVVTCFTETDTTADVRSASPIPEPVTDEATKPVNRTTSESKETTKAGSEDTFRTAITTTEINTGEPDLPADVSTEKVVPGTSEHQTEPSKDETSETTTVRPKESTHARKPSINAIKHTTTIATGTTENANKKQATITAADTSLTKRNVLITTIKSRFTSRGSPHTLTADRNGSNTISPMKPSAKVFYKFTQAHKTLSPCKGKCKSESTVKRPAGRQDNGKFPLTYDKTLYSAITMGCILILCTILALIVLIKDFVV